MSVTASATSLREFYDDFPGQVNDSVIVLQADGWNRGFETVTIEARAALKSGKGSWGIALGNYSVMLEFSSSSLSDIQGGDRPLIKVIDTESDAIVATLGGSPRAWSSKGENTLIVSITASGTMTIDGGHRVPEQIGDVAVDMPRNGAMSIVVNGKVESLRAVVETETDAIGLLSTNWDAATLEAHLDASDDRYETFWEYLDCTTNPDMAVAGGRYRLAGISDGEGGYDLIYAGGASVNPDLWHIGMIKAKLKPTIFENHYNVEWYDSNAESIIYDVSADIEQESILSINFPRYQSTLRFSRVAK